MADTYQILVDGTAVDPEIYTVLSSLVVEEHAELPGAVQLTLPIASDGAGDITRINDATFRPYANIAVVATPDGGSAQCIFDGYVLSQKIQLDRNLTASKLEVWGQDASWKMNLKEIVQEWPNTTDVTVANKIFQNNSMTPSPDNLADDPGPTHTEDGHSLMQRASDIQFLRMLAKRTGKLCRVACGAQAGVRMGYFAKPNLGGDPVATLTLNDPAKVMLAKLEIEWDVARPTETDAWQVLFDKPDTVDGKSTDSGLSLLGDNSLATFANQAMSTRLTTVVDTVGELQTRTAAVLREACFFVKCTGEVDLAALGSVLRVGTVVALSGVGSVHSGNYYVWSVQHSITQEGHRMKFEIVRNAVGSAPSSPQGPLAGVQP